MKNSILKYFIASGFLIILNVSIQAQEKAEKGSLKLDVSYYQANSETPVLKVSTKTKINKKFRPVEGVTVNLFMGEENAMGFLGRVVTKKDGTNSLALSARAKAVWDTSSVFKFIATVTGNDKFEDNSAEIEVTKAKIEVKLNEQDSVRTITAHLLASKDTGWVEVPEAELKFVVKRYFNDLQTGENATTDVSGNASSEFELTIPGDVEGNILVGAKLEENEMYGTILATQSIKWGTPLIKDNSFEERTLWATRDKTPLWLLIFPNIVIATVWGIIFYLIYLVMRIRKVGIDQQAN
jgi:hypothetical protein